MIFLTGGNKTHDGDDEITRERKNYCYIDFESAATKRYLQSKRYEEQQLKLDKKVDIVMRG